MAKKQTAKEKREAKERTREKQRQRQRRARERKKLREAGATEAEIEAADKATREADTLPKDYLDRIEAVTRLAPTATDAQLAAALGVSSARWRTMLDTYPDAELAAERGRHSTRKIVFANLIRKCQEGDARVLMFMAKHLLDWHDRVEHTGAGGGPVKSENTNTNTHRRGLTKEALRDLKANLFGVNLEPAKPANDTSDDDDDDGEATG